MLRLHYFEIWQMNDRKIQNILQNSKNGKCKEGKCVSNLKGNKTWLGWYFVHCFAYAKAHTNFVYFIVFVHSDIPEMWKKNRIKYWRISSNVCCYTSSFVTLGGISNHSITIWLSQIFTFSKSCQSFLSKERRKKTQKLFVSKMTVVLYYQKKTSFILWPQFEPFLNLNHSFWILIILYEF